MNEQNAGPPTKRKKLIRLDFPRDATPEEIAAAINKIRAEHGFGSKQKPEGDAKSLGPNTNARRDGN